MVKPLAISSLVLGILVLGMEEYRELLNILYSFFNFFKGYLQTIFSNGKIGVFLVDFVSITLVCISVTVIPNVIYMAIFKKRFTYTTETFIAVMLMTTSVVAMQ